MLPSFLVIGAPKAGTSSLHRYLGQHPDIFMSRVKEPTYFGLDDGCVPTFSGPGDDEQVNAVTVSHRADYEALFAAASPYAAAGESSTGYLGMPGTAARVAAAIPSARIVVVLREPAMRAFSHWVMKRDRGWEELSFEAALAAEEARLAAGFARCWAYREVGHYDEQLDQWRAAFPADQLHVSLYDDFVEDPETLVRSVFGFVGVDPGVDLDLAVHSNGRRSARNEPLRRLVRSEPARRMARATLSRSARQTLFRRIEAVNRERPDPATIAALREHYAPGVARLERWLGRSLDAWR
jgi:hypothetical protein